MFSYYSKLKPNAIEKNIKKRKSTIENSESTMCSQYRELTNMKEPYILYKSLEDDRLRKIISRWRLSCHKLHIETGRYKVPKVNKVNRICRLCYILEDEHHALLVCSAHVFIRQKHKDLLQKYTTVSEILNPKVNNDIKRVAMYLRDIEENMDSLDMGQQP